MSVLIIYFLTTYFFERIVGWNKLTVLVKIDDFSQNLQFLPKFYNYDQNLEFQLKLPN